MQQAFLSCVRRYPEELFQNTETFSATCLSEYVRGQKLFNNGLNAIVSTARPNRLAEE